MHKNHFALGLLTIAALILPLRSTSAIVRSVSSADSDVTVSKEIMPANPQPGDTIIVTITYTNTNTRTETTSIRDYFLPNTTYITNSATDTPQADPSVSRTYLSWRIRNMPSKTTSSLTYQMKVTGSPAVIAPPSPTPTPTPVASLSPSPAPLPTVSPSPSLTSSTLFVSPNGTDTHPCTESLPCRELRRAISLVKPGITILLADGTYKGTDIKSIRGTATAPITIKATGSNVAFTPTTDRPDNRDTIFISQSSHITVDGIRAFYANRTGVRVSQSQFITIKNGVFGYSQQGQGIFTDFSDDLRIENNETFGSKASHGIYVSNSGDRPIIRNNYAHHNAAGGIQLNADVSMGGDGIISGAVIENNQISENGLLGGAALNLDGVQQALIRNNTLTNNHASGIALFKGDGAQGAKDIQILDNTISMANDARWAVSLKNLAGAVTVRNNVLLNATPGAGGLAYGTSNDITHTTSDYNTFGGTNVHITPNDGNTRYTLHQWQGLGYEKSSIVQ